MIKTNYVKSKKRAVRGERILKGIKSFKDWYARWVIICNIAILIIHSLITFLTPYVVISSIVFFALVGIQPFILMFLPIFEMIADERWEQALLDDDSEKGY